MNKLVLLCRKLNVVSKTVKIIMNICSLLMISFTPTNSSCFLTDDTSRIRNGPTELHTPNANSANLFHLLEVVPGLLSAKVPGHKQARSYRRRSKPRPENCLFSLETQIVKTDDGMLKT